MKIKSVFNNLYVTWFVLALPSIAMLIALLRGSSLHHFIHSTGEFSARFMIIALMLSPLLVVFPKSNIVRWLISRRRALGVAAFCYAFAHTIFYLIDMRSVKLILDEFWDLGIWTGWFAFAVFIPLALTSNQAMVKKLKTKWKPLQRFVYLAAVLVLVHWIFVHHNYIAALAHFLPLIALQTYRVYQLNYNKESFSN